MNDWVPKVGDMVIVDLRGVPSVGIILEAADEHVLVVGGRWRERFHIDSVKHLAESAYRRDHGC